MTGISQVTENNRVTIPAEILEKSGIGIGTILKFELREDGILLTPQNTSEVSQNLSSLEEVSPADSFRQAWKEIQIGETLPVETLWDGIDAE